MNEAGYLCERCKTPTVELIPQGDKFPEVVRVMCSVQWCPACGAVYRDFDDEEGGGEFGWLLPEGPKVRVVSLHDDGEVVLLLDDGQDIDALLREWVALDDAMRAADGKEPPGWAGFTEWMAAHGVRAVEHDVESIRNFREDKP